MPSRWPTHTQSQQQRPASPSRLEPRRTSSNGSWRRSAPRSGRPGLPSSGRIVAQIMGAVATISLGLMLVQRYQAPVAAPAPPPAEVVPLAAVPVRLVTPGEASLAVLPLRDVSADGEDVVRERDDRGAHHRAGPPRRRSASCRGPHRLPTTKDGRPLPDIARALGVDFIVDGSVTRAEGRVRIVARLIDGRRDVNLLAESYDRPLRQVLDVQAQVAGAIARAIRDRPGGELEASIRDRVATETRAAPGDSRLALSAAVGES